VLKKSELNFKVLTISKDRTDLILEALVNSGIIDHQSKTSAQRFEAKAISFIKGVFTYWSDPFYEERNYFEEESSSPEVSLPEAIKIINSVKIDAPEFDIKPLDKVLMRDGLCEECKEWWPTFATCLIKDQYHLDDKRDTYLQMIKLEGNEHLMDTTNTPPGWWECENGRSVWRTK